METINLAKNATPNQRKINGKTLTQDVQLTATDVKAVTPEMLRTEIPVGVPLPWPTEKSANGLVYLQTVSHSIRKNTRSWHSPIHQANSLIYGASLSVAGMQDEKWITDAKY
ncbi:hypothetical protein [Arsenophonus sp. PmNCSU2021_1]|uniref:hypothetical protein n=1 Tax=Arsenophonus sp. PmNCSU2021_1 TaxID=3118989 RepID=UPI002FF0F753